jgi:Xaa-Pro dipeptidase
MNVEQIQEKIREKKLDGWLFFDHHQRDPLAYRILHFRPARHVTRRWYYFIPAEGEPVAIVHRIEAGMLDELPGAKRVYSSWKEQTEALSLTLRGCRLVAMQYSPRCAIPYVSMVDAGTVDLLKSLGVDVASSADLVQYFEARWDQSKLDSHIEAGRLVDDIRRSAFVHIGDRLRTGDRVDEYGVRRFILDRFREKGLTTDSGPIVAVNQNSSNPHYEPAKDFSREIRRGDFVLIDLWAKLDRLGSVYYDITWTGFCGETPEPEMEEIFDIVARARDSAIKTVHDAVAGGDTLRGFEVDDAARGLIEKAGYGEYFVHRTGHSIGEDVHGAGANMDNLESHDERQIIPWTCFSVEPGIYLPKFGIRSEVNVFVGEGEARVTGERQEKLVRIY